MAKSCEERLCHPKARPLQTRPKAVFSAILPEDILGIQEVTAKTGPFSVSARVQNGGEKPVCQDSALIFMTEGFAVLGVFDGCDEKGHESSRLLARRLRDLAKMRKQQLVRWLDSASLLRDAVGTGLKVSDAKAGTTCVLAVVSADRKYSICSIGDSAAFIAGKEVRRLFAYTLVADPKLWQTGQIAVSDLMKLKLNAYYYWEARSLLPHYIDDEGILYRDDSMAVFSESGKLPEGSRLLIASDGITGNLKIIMKGDLKSLAESVSPAGSEYVDDVSGCQDLGRIIKQARNPERVVKSVFDAISERQRRFGKKWVHIEKQNMLMPANDDASLIALSVS